MASNGKVIPFCKNIPKAYSQKKMNDAKLQIF